MVKVLGIPLYEQGLNSAVQEVIKICEFNDLKQNCCISATGAHGLVTSKKSPEFKRILSQFDINLPDGMPGVWIGKLKGAKSMTRCYGPDFFKLVMIRSANKNINHFFCGGKTGIAEELKIACQKRFGNFKIVGTYSPPFREMDAEELRNLAKEINQSKADIVWIGLSTPKQEKFALQLKNYTNVKFLITVGAAFDFHTNQIKQAPLFLQNSGLEWLFRLWTEPTRLYKRYLEIVPLFIVFNVIEFFQFLFNKSFRRKLYA